MTKKEVAQELKEEFNKGNFKPSQLKRSKSANDIANNNPPTPLLQEQLAEKQQEIENLRVKLAEKNTKLTETTQQLDNSLFARVEAVKQFGLIYDKLQQIKQELNETVEEASTEITHGDDKNSQLRTKLWTAQQQIVSLQRDLNLSQRLIELRKDYQPNNSPDLNYLQYGFYALSATILMVWLLHSKPTQ